MLWLQALFNRITFNSFAPEPNWSMNIISLYVWVNCKRWPQWAYILICVYWNSEKNLCPKNPNLIYHTIWLNVLLAEFRSLHWQIILIAMLTNRFFIIYCLFLSQNPKWFVTVKNCVRFNEYMEIDKNMLDVVIRMIFGYWCEMKKIENCCLSTIMACYIISHCWRPSKGKWLLKAEFHWTVKIFLSDMTNIQWKKRANMLMSHKKQSQTIRSPERRESAWKPSVSY